MSTKFLQTFTRIGALVSLCLIGFHELSASTSTRVQDELEEYYTCIVKTSGQTNYHSPHQSAIWHNQSLDLSFTTQLVQRGIYGQSNDVHRYTYHCHHCGDKRSTLNGYDYANAVLGNKCQKDTFYVDLNAAKLLMEFWSPKTSASSVSGL